MVVHPAELGKKWGRHRFMSVSEEWNFRYVSFELPLGFLGKGWEATRNKCLVVKNRALIKNLGSIIILMIYLEP